VIRDWEDFASSGFTDPGLSDVSELLFSPAFVLPDQSLLSIFFGISIPFAFPTQLLSSPFLFVSLLPLLLSLPPLLLASLIDLKELMSLDVGTPHSSSVVVVAADLELPMELPFSLGRSERTADGSSAEGSLLAEATDALTCSKKRTCTTTRRGRRSFCTACMHASCDSCLQSISPHNFFFSLFDRLGCSCKHAKQC